MSSKLTDTERAEIYAYILGKACGAMRFIQERPESEWREAMDSAMKMLDTDVAKVMYGDTTP